MGDRVRSALFSILGDIEGLDVLDAYAGSGALAFEAISRGARYAQLVDNNKSAFKTINENIEALGIEDRVTATFANISSWLKREQEQTFDLIFVDPPYDQLNPAVLEQLKNHLNQKGLMVLSHHGRGSAPTVNGVVVVDNRSYGNATLAFYRLVT
jgi:16S rRNA (guanine966-N2)-methyltransferase